MRRSVPKILEQLRLRVHSTDGIAYLFMFIRANVPISVIPHALWMNSGPRQTFQWKPQPQSTIDYRPFNLRLVSVDANTVLCVCVCAHRIACKFVYDWTLESFSLRQRRQWRWLPRWWLRQLRTYRNRFKFEPVACTLLFCVQHNLLHEWTIQSMVKHNEAVRCLYWNGYALYAIKWHGIM